MSSLGVCIAIVEDERILLTKRRDFPVWCLPGGALEDGETLAQAAVRETREETGLEARLTRLIGVYSRPHAGYFGRDELPDTLLRWHYWRAIDALDGRTGIARLQPIPWPAEFRDRQQAYQLRDQGRLSMPAFFERFCGRPDPARDVLETG